MASLRIACASSANTVVKAARPQSLSIVSAQASSNLRPRPASNTAPRAFKKFFGGFPSLPSGGQKEYKVRFAPRDASCLRSAASRSIRPCAARAQVLTAACGLPQGKYGDLIRRASFAMAGTQLAPTAAPEGQEIATFAGAALPLLACMHVARATFGPLWFQPLKNAV